MSSISSSAQDRDHAQDHAHDDRHTHADLSQSNITLPAGWGKGASMLMLGLGVLCLLATLAYAFITGDNDADKAKAAKHAISSYHVGYMVMLSFVLGSLGLVMIFTLVKAGWTAVLRRQLENVSSMMWLAVAMFAPIVFASLASPGILFKWMTPGLVETDMVLAAKAAFLNPVFFYVRLAIYFGVWMYLAARLVGYSRQQDTSRDKELTVKAGFTSAWGILAFAITVAFASFDLVKALDFHWFSTMFGVYFFAGNTLAALCLLAVINAALRSAGRLKGVVTAEHSHDLGKLMFAFTVFWAYISFCQYFLIWYANIPEETAWVMLRSHNGWQYFGISLIVLHFVVPFLFLLWKQNKRSTAALTVAASLLIALHCVDLFWVIRPVVYMLAPSDGIIQGKMGLSWVDITGLAGPVLIFGGLLIRKIASGSLIAIGDPRLPEALGHKNYI